MPENDLPEPPQFTATGVRCPRDMHDFLVNSSAMAVPSGPQGHPFVIHTVHLMVCRRCGATYLMGGDSQWHQAAYGTSFAELQRLAEEQAAKDREILLAKSSRALRRVDGSQA